HAATRGLMPPATANALAVSSRNVFAVLDEPERGDVRKLDLDSVFTRFQNKRAKDFTPESLTEYRRRVKKAAQLFLEWKKDPASFRAPTRATRASRKQKDEPSDDVEDVRMEPGTPIPTPGAY